MNDNSAPFYLNDYSYSSYNESSDSDYRETNLKNEKIKGISDLRKEMSYIKRTSLKRKIFKDYENIIGRKNNILYCKYMRVKCKKNKKQTVFTKAIKYFLEEDGGVCNSFYGKKSLSLLGILKLSFDNVGNVNQQRGRMSIMCY